MLGLVVRAVFVVVRLCQSRPHPKSVGSYVAISILPTLNVVTVRNRVAAMRETRDTAEIGVRQSDHQSVKLSKEDILW